jgi:hypothetical protein
MSRKAVSWMRIPIRPDPELLGHGGSGSWIIVPEPDFFDKNICTIFKIFSSKWFYSSLIRYIPYLLKMKKSLAAYYFSLKW